jgi:hypothetical protein
MVLVRHWPSVKIVEVMCQARYGYPNVVRGECGHVILTNRTTTVRCLECYQKNEEDK